MKPYRYRFAALVAGIIAGTVASRAWRALRAPAPGIAEEPQLFRVTAVEPPLPPPPRAGWKRWFVRIAALLLVLGLIGFAVAASGIVPIKASSGHWAVTRWFLQFAKSRSVATHTVGVTVPALDEAWMVLKGAGHYETACAQCHGSPQRTQSRVVSHMLPRPPSLKHIRSKRDAAELFHMVKHGIKFTGMPAWPTQNRDDEVWAMVAFLLHLPQLDGSDYQRLVYGDSSDAPPSTDPVADIAAQDCARCHGLNGNGRGGGAFPKLAGQQREYLFAALQAYADRTRHSGMMEPVAATLTPEMKRQLAEHYSKMRPAFSLDEPEESFERGRRIATHGIPDRRVPACAACHLVPQQERNPHYPNLAGQYAAYLKLQLELFKSRQRGGTAYSHIMQHVAEQLTKEQIEDLAAYFASLGPATN